MQELRERIQMANTSGQRILLRPEEGADVANVSRATIFKLLANGTIKSIKIGRSRRIPMSELQKWIDSEIERQCA